MTSPIEASTESPLSESALKHALTGTSRSPRISWTKKDVLVTF
jgi:hypothetical protein